jgi:hypothetical protein
VTNNFDQKPNFFSLSMSVMSVVLFSQTSKGSGLFIRFIICHHHHHHHHHLMKFSITESLLQRNDVLIKEILRLRKKNNKFIQELKSERRKAIKLDSRSVCTQTSPDLYQIPKSPVLRRTSIDVANVGVQISSSPSPPINPHLLTSATHNTTRSLLETYISPSKTSFRLQKERVVTPKKRTPTASPGVICLDFDDQIQQLHLEEDLMATPVSPARRSARRTSRRSSVGTPLSYKEPSLKEKIRKGHQYFNIVK